MAIKGSVNKVQIPHNCHMYFFVGSQIQNIRGLALSIQVLDSMCSPILIFNKSIQTLNGLQKTVTHFVAVYLLTSRVRLIMYNFCEIRLMLKKAFFSESI